MNIPGRRYSTSVRIGLAGVLIALYVAFGAPRRDLEGQSKNSTPMAPVFEVDPLWPKPLPNHWVLAVLAASPSTTRITSGC